MALGTWKEDPKENALLQETYAELGGNNESLSTSQKMVIAEKSHKIAGKTSIANEQAKGASYDS